MQHNLMHCKQADILESPSTKSVHVIQLTPTYQKIHFLSRILANSSSHSLKCFFPISASKDSSRVEHAHAHMRIYNVKVEEEPEEVRHGDVTAGVKRAWNVITAEKLSFFQS